MFIVRFLCVAILLTTVGCGFIQHADELSSMGDFARDKDNQSKLIKLNNQRYDDLVKAINAKEMSYFTNQVDIRNRFGEPISIKEIIVEGQKQQRWLYRHALIKEAKDRVYLYFDEKGKLLNYAQESIQWF